MTVTQQSELSTEVLVVGGGLGGVAAALAALDAGRQVVLTEEFSWLGGQLTSQAVPPDEHAWVEQFGVTRRYRALRDGIRRFYLDHYPVVESTRTRALFNPGAGYVSKLCHEPRVALAVIEAMLAPHRATGRLTVLQPARPVAGTTDGDRVSSVTVESVPAGTRTTITAGYVLDATETGELLPLLGVEYVTGFEAQSETGEPSAPAQAQPQNMQAVSVCFAVDHVDGDHTIDQPEEYHHWRSVQPDFWGSPLLSWSAPNPRTRQPMPRVFDPNPEWDPAEVDGDLSREGGDVNLWLFRRILARKNFRDGHFPSDVTLVNWPMIDYFEGSVIDVPDAAHHLHRARQLSLSALYWMQTEAPRPDGGTGFPGLRLRGDLLGTADGDGLAMAPYIRESRRILAQTTVVEQDVSLELRGEAGTRHHHDSIGVGMYRIDLHPSTGGDNYIDIGCTPFEIPLGSLLPRRITNLLAANKNIGTTHITNGCYRLHPVEWNIGEVAGLLAAHCIETGQHPDAVRNGPGLDDFLTRVRQQGIETGWPRVVGY